MITALIVIGLVLFAALVAVAFAYMRAQSERTSILERQLGLNVVPFWKHSLSVIAEILIHPHERYAGMDLLIKEALLEPAVRMPEDRSELLDTLLDERSCDTSEDMRPGERDAAIAFKHVLRMVRLEAENETELTGITVVGSKKAEEQLGEKEEE